VRGELEALVHYFDRDAAGNGRLIRELLQKDRQSFYAAAIEILRTRDDSRGSQYLISVLAAGDLLLPTLCESTLTRKQSLALAQAAFQAGVMADVILAKYLTEHAGSIGGSDCPSDIQRLMDLLTEISDGTRILPCMMTLARHQNPHLQSKAVLMIGRINRNVKWVQKRLAEHDPRVRANAIEALWGIESEEARQLLRSAARDGDNRAAGNALIALYRLGDCWVIPELLKMADHESRRFRATAAWVMGETADPRFTKALARMVGEPNISVRARAFAALAQIRTAAVQVRQAGELRIVARFQRNRWNGRCELRVEISSKDGREQINLLPTQLILLEDGQEVVSYSVEERPAPPAMAITFVLPRTAETPGNPFQAGALHALTWKRPSDLWAVAHYIPAQRPDLHTSFVGQSIDIPAVEDAPLEGIPQRFTCDPAVAKAALEEFPPKVDCSDLWSTIRRSVQMERGPARGKRHLLVYGQSEPGTLAGYPELVSAAMAARTSVHAISWSANPALEGLCRMTQGTFQTVTSENEVTVVVEEMCLSLQARYTVRYRPTADARELRVSVNTPSGWGETSIPTPLLPAPAA
jgi:hypothetical protein